MKKSHCQWVRIDKFIDDFIDTVLSVQFSLRTKLVIFKSFQSSRSFSVKSSNLASQPLPHSCGVSQGSVRGSLVRAAFAFGSNNRLHRLNRLHSFTINTPIHYKQVTWYAPNHLNYSPTRTVILAKINSYPHISPWTFPRNFHPRTFLPVDLNST